MASRPTCSKPIVELLLIDLWALKLVPTNRSRQVRQQRKPNEATYVRTNKRAQKNILDVVAVKGEDGERKRIKTIKVISRAQLDRRATSAPASPKMTKRAGNSWRYFCLPPKSSTCRACTDPWLCVEVGSARCWEVPRIKFSMYQDWEIKCSLRGKRWWWRD
jgi:hypothetical protein